MIRILAGFILGALAAGGSLLSGLYGAAVLAATHFYDIEQWPLALAALAQFAVTGGLYVPVAMALGWGHILKVEICLFAVSFLVWLSLYGFYKTQIKKMNEWIARGR